MKDIITIAAAGFVSVFALGFQSRNVNHGNYGWAAGTSLFVGVSQATVWRQVMRADAGWLEILAYALSGAAGIVTSMYVHRRFIQRMPR